MNVYKELEEVGYNQVKLKNMTDNILDAYKKNPKECERLLKELLKINEELKILNKEFLKFT